MKTKPAPSFQQHNYILDEIARAADAVCYLPGDLDEKDRPEDMPDGFAAGDPPFDTGHSVSRQALDDEKSPGEQLFRGGIEAAESDRRRAAEIGRMDQTRL